MTLLSLPLDRLPRSAVSRCHAAPLSPDVVAARTGKPAGSRRVNTVAALARRGVETTLLMPRGPDDPVLTPGDLRGLFRGRGGVPARPAARAAGRARRWSGPCSGCGRCSAIRKSRGRICSIRAFRRCWAWADARPCRSPSIITGPGPTICRSSGRCSGGRRAHANASASSSTPLMRRVPMHGRACRRRKCWSRITAPSRGGWGRRSDKERGAGAAAARSGPLHRGLCGPGQCAEGAGCSCLRWRTLRPETLFLLVGSEGEGPVEAEARRARQCPGRAVAGSRRAAGLAARGGRAADPAVAGAAGAVSQLRAAAEALRLSRRRPADPRAGGAGYRGAAARTGRMPCSSRPAIPRRRRRRWTGCAIRRWRRGSAPPPMRCRRS